MMMSQRKRCWQKSLPKGILEILHDIEKEKDKMQADPNLERCMTISQNIE